MILWETMRHILSLRRWDLRIDSQMGVQIVKTFACKYLALGGTSMGSFLRHSYLHWYVFLASLLNTIQTATSIELRSRFPLSYISYSQCQRHFERKWISDDTFMIGNNLLEEVSTEFRESNSGAIHLESDVIDNLPHSTKSMSIPLPLLGKITKAFYFSYTSDF